VVSFLFPVIIEEVNANETNLKIISFMAITSIHFVLITLLAIPFFYLLNNKFKVVFLVLLSCLFIASYSYWLLLYVISYSLLNFFLGLKLADSPHKKFIFKLGIILNLTQLIVLKYSSFAIDPLVAKLGINAEFAKIAEIIIPIGVSYFTLQGIGYLINIKMLWEKPQNRFAHFLLFMTFYPKFLSGPVERSNHFLPQINKEISFNPDQVTIGLRIALFGFFKKIAIANQLAPYVLKAYSDIPTADGYLLWVLFFTVPLYLYFDFSGYTDIAIGLAKIFGIDLLPNFNRPFFAENVTTFWKRFHISLSSWFNDYVFRQTSFKYRRFGIYSSVIALLVTWTLFGIWHGAGWNFMILGFLQAVIIIYEYFSKKQRILFFSKIPSGLRIGLGRLFTYLFYCVSLVFFFSPDLVNVFGYFEKMFGVAGSPNLGPLSLSPFSVMIYIPLLLAIELINEDRILAFERLNRVWTSRNRNARMLRWLVYCTAITIIFVVGNEVNQFVYVNF